MADEKLNKGISRFSLLIKVFKFAAPYRNKLYWSIFLAVLLAVFSPLRPWLIEITINKGLKPGPGLLGLHGGVQVVVGITIIQLGLILVETIARFFFTFFTASIGQHVVNDMRVQTYQKILSLNLSQFDKTPIGTLTTRTINDIESINDIFSDGLIPIIADLLSIISILTYMFCVNWKLTFVCITPFPLLIIATYYFKETVNKSFVRVRNAVAALNAFVQEHLTGMSVVQAFAAESIEGKKFTQINREHRNANIRSIFAYSVFFPIVELVLALSLGLLIWRAGSERSPEVAGIITSFILCLNLLFRPLRVIADKFNVLQMGMIASERVFKVMNNQDITVNQGRYMPEKFSGDVKFSNVSFSYIEGRKVLKNISFSINSGETLAIVGHTGSGKTSIISLINRLYKINEGKIEIDGTNIEDFDLNFLRSKIAVVLQDVFLFGGSVKDNITLLNPEISIEKVETAAKMIGVHNFIMQLPGGYSYNVMERGATLSMGQRQLLSFVRALLYNPSILILDEATSSIDTESEQLIQTAIEKLIAGRTSIVIAHRLSTIRKATKIIVLDKGEIVEFGTHEELIDKNGFYHRLYKMQFQKGNRM